MTQRVYAIFHSGSTYSYQAVPNLASGITAVPLTGNISVSAPSGSGGSKIGFQIILSRTDNTAAGVFQVSTSTTGASNSWVPLLTSAQGTVAAGVFTGSSTNVLMLVNGPNLSNYIQITWTGTATGDTAKIVFEYEG